MRLDIIKILNNNGTLDEAKATIESQDHSGMSYGLVCAMVKEFCDRGEEFVEYVMGKIYNRKRQKKSHI